MARVVIIGGGFGGLYAARRFRGQPVDVTLIDRRNHHLFQPLLYQVAMAALSPGDIASPIRWILRKQRNVAVLLGEAARIDTARRTVVLTDGAEISYDYLIVASGSTHAYFGHDDWRPHAPGLKTLEDALEIRKRVLLAFEHAERETDPTRRAAQLTFVIVGGGPTGVEMAGALAEIARQSLARDFRHFDPSSAKIVLVEGGPSVLANFPEELRDAARRDLVRLGVDVRTGSAVTRIAPGGVETSTGRIAAETVLWAAGVAASPLGATLNVPLDRAGRVLVQPDLTIPGQANVFVIGDLASLAGENGKPLPGVAQVAMQMGAHAASNILRAVEGQPLRAFHYFNWGDMATIGRASAVADMPWIRLQGFLGWLAWLFIHLVKLIGFRNRIVVMVQWIWSYVTYQRAIRLITGDPAAGMRRRVAWTILFVIAAAAAALPLSQDAVERFYSRGFFPPLQQALTTISNLVPFALFDAMWMGAVALAVVVIRRRVKTHGWLGGAARSLRALGCAAVVIYLAFLATWGLNYRRVPMFEKVVFHPERVTQEESSRLGEWAVNELNTHYAAAHKSPLSLDALRSSFDAALGSLGGAPIVVGRPKATLLGWYFHKASIAGMTDPFLLETMLAPDLLDVERPFVIAHEWAHLAGYADESEANFVAYLACRRGDALARYSAGLVMIGYARPARSINAALEMGPKLDLLAIQARYARTSGTLRFAAREGYDKYLKANRVERGIESYDAVVQLILGTEFDANGNPRLR